jgi:hypothetical protein
MCSDSSRQGGNEKGVTQIEVTPEMIEAGIAVYRDWIEGKRRWKLPSEAAFVVSLYRDMEATRVDGNPPSP